MQGEARSSSDCEYLDVVIVGAGISGIGAAYYLQREHPRRSYAILEARGASGGTWDLFRYPGVRSDSDLYTFGYAFKPWVDEKAIADAGGILAYLRETAAENGIDRRIRYHRRLRSAAWSSDQARWVLEIECTDTGEHTRLACNWLFCAGGYYRYDHGYTPHFEGRERFPGPIIHPQRWPEDLDYAGKRVVVIGSGATAVTLVPAMAREAAHVTMLQRTPTYILPVPSVDTLAERFKRLLPAGLAYRLTRRKNIARQRWVWRLSQRYPRLVRWLIRYVNRKSLPEGYPVNTHFNPPYDPWDQRLCVVPDGDLYHAIKAGRASVVTDNVETFTERGVRLASGQELEADIIITATGLELLPFGGIELRVDGEPVDLPEHVAFRGMMLSGVPNYAFAVGYTNSSWTLKVDLVCAHLMRLLSHMDAHGYDHCRPELPEAGMATRPLLDFDAGYVKRAMHKLPRQGDRAPWLMAMDYYTDVRMLRKGPVTHADLRFYRAERARAPAARG
ncbi:NAD(P)/FAD-dependent oxidoreductase, partial [Ectothiorhodospiraceae bacterium WFHF3C12]|nr:NAD(P)/FAD-dependent oxidoreductase [Ectothiorhodospiraceae bacterium WFHF3C12]